MKLQESKVVLIIGSFILGGLATYFITDYFHMKKQLNKNETAISVTPKLPAKQFKLKNNKDQADSFKQMDKIHDQIRKRMGKAFSGSMFGDSLLGNNFFDADHFGDISSDGLKIEEREDDDFKYFEIIADGIDRDSININIEGGMISVSGEIIRSDDNQAQNSRSTSSFISKFSRSFNIPYGVNKDNVKIDTEDNKIIIKFPKDKI